MFRVWFHLYVVQSPVRTRTPTSYLDFKLDPGATVTQPVTEGWLITYSCFNHSLAFLHIKVVLASFLVSFTQLSGFFVSCHPASFPGVEEGPLCLGTRLSFTQLSGFFASCHPASFPGVEEGPLCLGTRLSFTQLSGFFASCHPASFPDAEEGPLCLGMRTQLSGFFASCHPASFPVAEEGPLHLGMRLSFTQLSGFFASCTQQLVGVERMS